MANEITAHYTVHSAAVVPHPITTTIEGEAHEVVAKAIVIELVPNEGSHHGSVKLVKVAGAKALADMQLALKPGTKIAATYSIVKES